jgi:hypothetical protein
MLPARGCLSKSDLLEPKHVKIKTLLAKIVFGVAAVLVERRAQPKALAWVFRLGR